MSAENERKALLNCYANAAVRPRESVVGVFLVAVVDKVRAKTLHDVGWDRLLRHFMKFKVDGVRIVGAGRADRTQQITINVSPCEFRLRYVGSYIPHIV